MEQFPDNRMLDFGPMRLAAVNSRAASSEAARVFHDRWITGLVPAWTPTHAPAAPGAPTHH